MSAALSNGLEPVWIFKASFVVVLILIGTQRLSQFLCSDLGLNASTPFLIQGNANLSPQREGIHMGKVGGGEGGELMKGRYKVVSAIWKVWSFIHLTL